MSVTVPTDAREATTAHFTEPLPRVLLVTFGSLCAPRHGTAVRGRAIVEALAGLDVPLDVVSVEEPSSSAELRALAGVDDARAVAGPTRYGWSIELVRACRELAGKADVLLVGSAMLLPGVLLAAPRLPVVWDANECETLLYGRMRRDRATVVKGAIWNVVERAAVRRSAVVVSVSETEAEHWRRLFPAVARKLHVVAHRPVIAPGAGPGTPEGGRPPPALPDSRMAVFVGAVSAKHNWSAANWLLEDLAPRLPTGTALVIAGPGTEKLTAPRTTCGGSVHLLGAVDDLDSVLRAAHVCVAPLLAGAGVKTKVLHYLAEGKPVVCTPTATEGLESAPGVEVRELASFSDAVLRALRGDEPPAVRAERRAAQERWLSEHHGPGVVATQWAAVLRSCGTRRGSTT